MVGISEEDVKTLCWLGLTSRQARVYLSLLKTGVAKTETVSSVSRVNRQEVYRIIAALQDRGFIENLAGSPTKYRAIPVNVAIKYLVDKKTDELRDIREKAVRLSEKYDPINLQAPPLLDDSKLVIVSGIGQFRRNDEATRLAQQSIDVVTSWKKFCQSTVEIDQLMKEAMERGVIMRTVTEKPNGATLPKWAKDTLARYPSNFKLRTFEHDCSASTVIFDGTLMSLDIDISSDLMGAHLWSRSNSQITMSQAYFDQIWEHSEKPL